MIVTKTNLKRILFPFSCFRDKLKGGRIGDSCSRNADCTELNCVAVVCDSTDRYCKRKGEKCEKVGAKGCYKGKKCKTSSECCPNKGDLTGVCDIDVPDFDHKGKYVCTTGPPKP